jgi:DNA primase
LLERVIEEFGIISVKGRSDYCPFCHSDSDGVFSFNDEVFHCFSCGKAGDAVTFVRELKSVGYYEAVKIIYEDILKQQIPHNIASKMSKIREIEAKYLNCSLSPVAKEYLQKRGITDATIDAGGIISNGNNIIFPIKDIHGNIIGDIKGLR